MPQQFVEPVTRASGACTRAVVMVLHGGRADSCEPSRPWHLSAVRMVPFARALHSELGDQGVAVWSVRYRYRGWNGAAASPVDDARNALERVRAAHGDVPVVLLGHSMGARTALRVCDDPSVVGVVALAPWLPPGEPVRVRGRLVHLAHGTADRWTDPAGTHAWAERARSEASELVVTDVPQGGHFMLSDIVTWNRLARDGVVAGLRAALGALDGAPLDPSEPPGGSE